MKEKKYKIEDALNATRAAVEEGIILGGGSAFVKVAYALKNFIKEKVTDEEQIGVKIVQQAMLAPFRQIAFNAGLTDVSLIIEKIKDINNPNQGYDFIAGEVKDLLSTGVIDPLKVARTALENAASIASTLLTTEAVVTDIPEEKENSQSMPDMSGGMPGMGMM